MEKPWHSEDETIKELVEFFNRFGFELDTKDFTFIDKYKNSYTYNERTKYIQTFESFRIKRKNK